MPRFGIGIRWWLGLAFALIAGLAALVVALVVMQRAEAAFNSRSDELAVGSTVAAAESIHRALVTDTLDAELPEIAARRGLALFVFDEQGNLLSPARSRRTELSFVPKRAEALEAALAGQRFSTTLEGGVATVVALPIRDTAEAAAVLAYVPQPEFAASVGIFRREIVIAALVALGVGALVGLLAASLIAIRLRRIAGAAATIERGDFDTELHPRFGDEVGELAETIDRMRGHLRDSFAQLEAERDRLGRLLERLREGVVTVDRSLTIEFANAAARRALAAPRLAEGDPLPDPWPGFPLRRLVASLFRDDAKTVESRVAEGDERTYAVTGIPAGLHGESAVVVFTDITEQERRERAEREFVTNAAHELRTPLAAIVGAVDVLQAGAKNDEDARNRFIGHVERESARLSRLVRALLVLARAQTGQESPQLGPLELRPLLEEIAGRLTPDDGVEVLLSCPPDLAALSEAALLEQVIANLADNAVKHTRRGQIELAAYELPGRGVAVEVRDTGTGIAPADRERVFDRFYRGGDRAADGFGLGLAIARQSARALGGVVEIDSAADRGTTARVVLPGSAYPEPAAPRTVPSR
jgi:two-component system phosphate regulon sensor histidine kinase PhoR